jgi:phage baseplate assembly protein W
MGVSVPHFALPFRYINGSAVVNEQDSLDDIADCVYAICLTNPGDRSELPDFGITDPAFQELPLNTTVLQQQIEAWEPRVQLLIDAAPDQYDLSVTNAQVTVELAQSA